MKGKESVDQGMRQISEDKITVKKEYEIMTFTIFHNHSEISKVSIGSKSTVGDLMTTIRHKLSKKNFPTEKILYLESMTQDEVLDYSLLITSYCLKNYKHN